MVIRITGFPKSTKENKNKPNEKPIDSSVLILVTRCIKIPARSQSTVKETPRGGGLRLVSRQEASETFTDVRKEVRNVALASLLLLWQMTSSQKA